MAGSACRRQREQQGRPRRERRDQRRHDHGRDVGLELAQDSGEVPRGLPRPMRAVELIPDRRKRVSEIAQKIRQHLADRLLLTLVLQATANVFYAGWYSWIRLPHVSANTASVTGPACAGCRVNATPFAVNRANSAAMSATSKAASGMPCENIAS